MRLQQYDFYITHRTGEGNPADVLSRQPLLLTETKCGVVDQHINFVEKLSVLTAMSVQQIATAIQDDEELQQMSAGWKSG